MVVASQPNSPAPPPVGTLIDNGSLELVQILGYGGYGIVYRAIDTYTSHPTSYAVKCLPHSPKRNAARQRQLHIREITLHQLASAHPGVVTLHRVIEEYDYTWIVMDYCPDGDLFTQILQHRRYLGNNELIKEVFLQLLDAVEYCHSLNIYHRDLKPENILCFENGLRLAITDFGLATTDRMSTEFRTGSVYHMSPECQGGEFAPTKSYSPLFNDIWSLGIILLNLITGRNPWKSASADDCTFQAYLRDPRHFLPTVLPISEEVNRLLVRTLEVDWRRRTTLREMRQAVANISNFYSPDVLFEDSMARCPWEAGVNAEEEEDEESLSAEDAQVDVAEVEEYHDSEPASQWSHDSDSEMVFAHPSVEVSGWTLSPSRDATCTALSTRSLSPSPSPPMFPHELDELRTPSVPSTYSAASSCYSISSPPATPNPDEMLFDDSARRPLHLTLDIEALRSNYYPGSVDMLSAQSSTMQTALESAQLDGYGPYSAFYIAESEKASTLFDGMDDSGMITDFEDEDVMETADVMSAYSYMPHETHDAQDASLTELSAARPESPVLGLDFGLPPAQPDPVESEPTFNWSTLPTIAPSEEHTPAFSFLTFATPSARIASISTFSYTSAATSPHSTDGSLYASSPRQAPSAKQDISPYDSRTRKSRLLNPVRLAFTRRSHSRSRTPSPESSPHVGKVAFPQADIATHWTLAASVAPEQPPPCFATPAPAAPKVAGAVDAGTSTSVAKNNTQGIRRRFTRRRLRSARDWFSPGKLFSGLIPSPQ